MNRRILVVEWLLELQETGGSHAPEVKNQESSRRPLSYAVDAATGARRPWITPKSMVGAFADHLERHYGPDIRDRLLGDRFGTPVSSTNGSSPSRLRFLGSQFELPTESEVVQRHRAAQDRRRGAARVGHLVKAEWMPAETTIRLWALIDAALGPAGENWEDLVASVVRVSVGDAAPKTPSWSPFLGSGKSTGNGRTRLVGLRTRELDLGRPSDLAAFLQGVSPARIAGLLSRGKSHAARIVPAAGTDTLLKTRWRLDGPLHIGSGSTRSVDGSEVGRVVTDRAGRPSVPATSWKGLVRSRAEFILRSLDISVCEGGTRRDEAGNQSRPCDGCPVCDIFGGTGQRTGSAGSGYAARIRFESSSIEGAQVRQNPRTHVAIDRFTGGAATGLLYTRDAVETGCVDLVVTCIPGRAVPGHAEQLIDLALRDLTDGLIGLGGGSSRGYGDLRLVVDPPAFDFGAWRASVESLRTEQESGHAGN